MPARCLSCHAAVPDGTEICESCRTTQLPKLELEALSDGIGSVGENSVRSWPQLGPLGSEEDEVTFCGRDAELGRLAALVEEAVRGRRLSGALLLGSPGLGKSRLLRELGRFAIQHLGVPKDRILVASVPAEGSSRAVAVAELLRQRCDLLPGEPGHTAREKLLRTCRALLPAVRATEVAHILGGLLGIPFPDSPVVENSQTTGGETRATMALRRFLAADAARGPLLILLDDAEHFNEEMLQGIAYMIDGLTALPVFFGLFGRPELLEQQELAGTHLGEFARVSIEPLADSESLELFATAIGVEQHEIPPSIAEYILSQAQGSPRTVVELIRLLIENNILSFQGKGPGQGQGQGQGETELAAAWDETALAEQALPEGLEGLAAARLQTLSAAARAVLEQAAVCGETFYLDALLMLSRCTQAGLGLAVAGADDGARYASGDVDGLPLDDCLLGDAFDPREPGQAGAELSALLTQLTGQGILAPVTVSPLRGETAYRFAYQPWQKIVYGETAHADRRRWHRLYAQWLVLHLESGGEDLVETIARHFERAAAGADAARYYRQAAELMSARGQHGRAPRLYLRALSCLGGEDLSLRTALWLALGRALLQKADPEGALQAFEKAVRLSFTSASRTQLAESCQAIGHIYAQKGEPARALDFLGRALLRYQELGDPHGIADALDDTGRVLWALGRPDEALDRSGRALELRRRLGDRRKVAASLLHIGSIEQHRGLLDAAQSCFEEAMRKHDGDHALLVGCLSAIGGLSLLRGELGEAEARLAEALAIAERLPPAAETVALLGLYAETLMKQGRLQDAEARLESARRMAERLADRRALAEIERLSGLLLLSFGQHKAALSACQRALDKAQENGFRHEIGRALLSLGEVHAAALFDETVEGQHPAWDYFRRSVALLRESGDQAELAYALSAMGRHLIERGRLGPGKGALKDALEISRRLRMRAADELSSVLAEL